MIETDNRKTLFNLYFILIFGFMPMVVTPWRSEVFYDGKILFSGLITFAFFGACFFITRKAKLKVSITQVLLAVLLVISILSTVFSIDFRLSILGEPKLREGLISLIIYFAVFYLCYSEFAFSKRLLEGILVIASVIGIYGILNYLAIVPGIEKIAGVEMIDGLSTIGNRNFVGIYCTLFIPLAMGFYFKYRHNRAIIYNAILFALLMASNTRSAWVALALSIPVYFAMLLLSMYFTGRNGNNQVGSTLRKYFYGVILFIILFTGIFASINYYKNNDLVKRFNILVSDANNIHNEKAGSKRIYFWKQTMPFIYDHPLLGNGPDTYGKFMSDKKLKYTILFPKAHNEYLQMVLTLGYPYLIVYLCLVGVVLARLLRKALRTGDVLVMAVFCCVFGYLVQAFFNVSVISTAPIYWGLLGVGARVGEDG